MNIQHVQKAMMWRELIIGVFVDLALCTVAWWYFSDEDSRSWLEVLLLFAMVQVVFLLVAFRNLIVRIALFKATDAEFLENLYLANLRETGLPRPQLYHPTNTSMFQAMADDVELQPDVRVKAAWFGVTFLASTARVGFARSMMMEAAMDRAIQRYVQGLPEFG